jgi:hypothetical protein
MNRSIATLALAFAAAVSSTAVAAEETVCRGTLGARAFDNIFVPDDASCTLNRTRLNGSIVVGRGASLQANGVRVNGSVQAEGALQVGIGPGSQIGGSVQIKQGGGASITGARISGDLQFEENVLPLAATDSLIGGNLQAVKNTGGVTFERNRIDGNLQCKENEPAPVGGRNLASSKEDQCEAL